MEEIQPHIDAIITYLQDQPDPISGAGETTQMLRVVIPQLNKTVAELRSGFLRAGVQGGWSLEELAEACQMTRQRVEQIVNR